MAEKSAMHRQLKDLSRKACLRTNKSISKPDLYIDTQKPESNYDNRRNLILTNALDGRRIYFCTKNGLLLELGGIEPPRWEIRLIIIHMTFNLNVFN